jgi:hypothetical protein
MSMFVNQNVRSRQTAYSIALPETATYGWCAGPTDKSPISVDDDGVPTQSSGSLEGMSDAQFPSP